MIKVLNSISGYNYSKSFPDLIIQTDAPSLAFELTNHITNDSIIVEHYDNPPSGQSLLVPLKGLFDLDLQFNLPDFSKIVSLHPNVLKNYSVTLSAEGNNPYVLNPFNVIRGLAYKQSIVDTQLFLNSNILSLRHSSSFVYDYEPVCLSFLSRAAADILIDISFVDGTSDQINYAAIAGNIVQSVNVSYGEVQRLVSKKIVSYKVYASISGQPITNKMELVLQPFDFLRESYLYANRLGGWDTISFIGEEYEVNSVNPFTANLRDDLLQYDVDISRVKTKNTGYIRTAADHLQVVDFLQSSHKYVLENGTLLPIVMRQAEPEYTKGLLNSFSFVYTYANKIDQFKAVDFAKPFISIS